MSFLKVLDILSLHFDVDVVNSHKVENGTILEVNDLNIFIPKDILDDVENGQTERLGNYLLEVKQDSIKIQKLEAKNNIGIDIVDFILNDLDNMDQNIQFLNMFLENLNSKKHELEKLSILSSENKLDEYSNVYYDLLIPLYKA